MLLLSSRKRYSYPAYPPYLSVDLKVFCSANKFSILDSCCFFLSSCCLTSLWQWAISLFIWFSSIYAMFQIVWSSDKIMWATDMEPIRMYIMPGKYLVLFDYHVLEFSWLSDCLRLKPTFREIETEAGVKKKCSRERYWHVIAVTMQCFKIDWNIIALDLSL